MDGVIHICVTWCEIGQKLCKNWRKNKYVCMYISIYVRCVRIASKWDIEFYR